MADTAGFERALLSQNMGDEYRVIVEFLVK
jgi:hypothetical protein